MVIARDFIKILPSFVFCSIILLMSNEPIEATAADPPLFPVPPKTQERLSITEWQNRKGVKRDLLCLAAVAQRWDWAQAEGSLDEDFVTEDEFDGAIVGASQLFEAMRKEHGKKVLVISHPNYLLAVIMRRASKAKLEAHGAIRDDEKMVDGQKNVETQQLVLDDLLWPKQGSNSFGDLMDLAPDFLFNYLPIRWRESAGSMAIFAKKVG